MKTEEKYIYILRLVEDNFYVGVSSNPKSRIESHLFNNGHHWTTQYPPIEVLGIYGPTENYLSLENEFAIWLAVLFGTECVAGGKYTTLQPHHGFPPALRRLNSPGWDVIKSDFKGIPLDEYLNLPLPVSEYASPESVRPKRSLDL